VKPPYARGFPMPIEEVPLQVSGKIELGGEAELKIREAALLAKKVREFAGTQVTVRTYFLRTLSLSLSWPKLTRNNAINRLERLQTP
jgi:hypothetical protein